MDGYDNPTLTDCNVKTEAIKEDPILPYDELGNILQANELPDWMFEFSDLYNGTSKCDQKPIKVKPGCSKTETLAPLKTVKGGSETKSEFYAIDAFASDESPEYERNDKHKEVKTVAVKAESLKKEIDEDVDRAQIDNKSPGDLANQVGIYNTPRQREASREPVSLPHEVEATTPMKVRAIPTPVLQCPENEEFWQTLVFKEEAMVKCRNYHIFDNRSAYLPRMRAILLDWIMEVCDVYRLRRNTYYLALDYIDKYLTIRPSVPKTHLQLLGISCLFIASKLEEIYPPKLNEFAYVCDGACTESDILACELLLLNILSWEVNPQTPSGWLNLYMQIYYYTQNNDGIGIKLMDKHFQYPQYSGYQFVKASNIMDLFSMDPGFFKFSYSVIAASAMYFVCGKSAALTASGLKWKQLRPCVQYMSVFDRVIKEAIDPRFSTIIPEIEDKRLSTSFKFIRKNVPQVITDENHCLQTHLLNLDYFEKAVFLRVKLYGVIINKVYVKKVKLDMGDIEYVSSYEEMPGDSGIVMYELTPKKENMQDGSPSMHPADPDYEPGKVNIFTVKQKTIVTLDDILASVHNDCSAIKPKLALQQITSKTKGYQ